MGTSVSYRLHDAAAEDGPLRTDRHQHARPGAHGQGEGAVGIGSLLLGVVHAPGAQVAADRWAGAVRQAKAEAESAAVPVGAWMAPF